MTVKLHLTEQEHELLVRALERWRWNIAEDGNSKPTFYDAGHKQACRFVTCRIDEMLKRLAWLVNPIEPTT